jgi:low temperature requirement protein LtrA
MSAPPREVERVTTLELFFDLVFVFTITQLTAVLYHAPTGRSVVQVVLMLGVIWWMYGGYAWMTNTVPAATPRRRLVLLGGMAGFFVLALSIPHAFSSSGLAFGLSYLVVVSVHSALFMRASAASVVQAILRLTPWNVASALVVVAGGALGGKAQYGLWAGAFLLEWLTPVIRGNRGFDIGAAHFVERHGLVIIIAIGESVVAVGIASTQLAVDGSLVLTALLGLALSACLWWSYFSAAEERAERALGALEPVDRARAALRGFGYLHIPMLLGIVTIAAAERRGFAHPFSELGWRAAGLLGGGVAAFLAGEAMFRRELALGRGAIQLLAATAAAATIPVGAYGSAVAQTGALVLVLVASFVTQPRGGG